MTEKVKEPFTGIDFDRKREKGQPEACGEYHLLGTAVCLDRFSTESLDNSIYDMLFYSVYFL